MKNFFNIDPKLLKAIVVKYTPKKLGERTVSIDESDRSLDIKTSRVSHLSYGLESLFLYLFFRDQNRRLSFRITYHLRPIVTKSPFDDNTFEKCLISENIVTGNKRKLMTDNQKYIEDNIEKMLNDLLKK